MGTTITFKRPDGKDASGYFARAPQANAPGIVVIQEWWGVQDQIKGMADRLAAAGYDALAPDLYAGVIVPYHDREAAQREMGSLNFVDATEQTVRGGAQYLARNGAKVAITGCCLGGSVTIIAAARVPDFSVGVCFYGIPPEAVTKPADIKIPLQCHFATHDDWCTPALVDKLEHDAKAAGKDIEIFRYDTHHGFINEQRPDVHARAEAELAWGRMLDYLQKHLH